MLKKAGLRKKWKNNITFWFYFVPKYILPALSTKSKLNVFAYKTGYFQNVKKVL